MQINEARKYFAISQMSKAEALARPKEKWKIRDFSLTLVLFGLFLVSVIGQFVAGYQALNSEREERGFAPLVSLIDYAGSGHFISSVAENMESEFLQMAFFVFLTIFLYQKGSAESKKPKEEETEKDRLQEKTEKDLSAKQKSTSKWSWLIYENSLTLALAAIFIVSFLTHAWGSYKLVNENHIMNHVPLISFSEIFSESEFWFESFQNWQSEFFSIAVMGLLSISLRQKGSPQSKKLWDPNWKTGNE